MKPPCRRTSFGFTIIELLIVLTIIGIIAAIAIPNLVEALHKGKHKRSVGDMRTIATGLETYNLDNEQYPEQDGGGTISNVEAHLEPTYLKLVPTQDGWSNDFRYTTIDEGDDYTLVSYGRDAADGGPAGSPPMPPVTSWDDDIVFSGGTFLNLRQ